MSLNIITYANRVWAMRIGHDNQNPVYLEYGNIYPFCCILPCKHYVHAVIINT